MPEPRRQCLDGKPGCRIQSWAPNISPIIDFRSNNFRRVAIECGADHYRLTMGHPIAPLTAYYEAFSLPLRTFAFRQERTFVVFSRMTEMRDKADLHYPSRDGNECTLIIDRSSPSFLRCS
jgi:hypothetical protein